MLKVTYSQVGATSGVLPAGYHHVRAERAIGHGRAHFERGEVKFTIVAFSKPGRWFTRLGEPVARLVQKRMTRRYLEALDSRSHPTQ